MAVTIHQSPQSYTPSDNPIVWVFSSNQTANTNFVYFVEVYVNGVKKEDNLIFPDNGIYARFDASDIASRFTNVPSFGSSFQQSASNNCEIYIKVYERYGSPPALAASATSSTITAFKAALNDENFINWDNTEYVFGSGNKWLTLFPSTEKYYCGPLENTWLTMLTDNTVGLYCEIELFDEDGNLIIADSAALGQYKFTIINASQAAIIAATSITQLQFDQASYYELWLDPGGDPSSKFRIYVDPVCSKNDPKRFIFISSIGSIESFSYTKSTKKTREVKRYGFETGFGRWDDSNNFVFDLEKGRSKDYLVTSSGKMTVESDWLTQGVQNWLVEELYESPYVFIEFNSTRYRCKILNTAYEYKKRKTGTIFNETVEVGLSDQRKSITI